MRELNSGALRITGTTSQQHYTLSTQGIAFPFFITVLLHLQAIVEIFG